PCCRRARARYGCRGAVVVLGIRPRDVDVGHLALGIRRERQVRWLKAGDGRRSDRERYDDESDCKTRRAPQQASPHENLLDRTPSPLAGGVSHVRRDEMCSKVGPSDGLGCARSLRGRVDLDRGTDTTWCADERVEPTDQLERLARIDEPRKV